MAQVTRDDVARLAGVAPSTVSNVLNCKTNVSEKLKKKVLKAIKELNYTPNMVARSLMTKSSRQIGLIMEDITNPHFAGMAKGAQYEAATNGYVLSVNIAAKDIDQVVEDYISRHVDGIIFNAYSGMLSQKVKDKLKSSGIVCVRCGDMGDIDFPYIGIDYYNGMKKAYSHLYDKGHSKICYISGVNRDWPRELRAMSFKWCCENIGHGFDENYIVYGTPPFATDIKAGYLHCSELFNKGIDFTAIIIANDYMALGAVRYLRAIRKNIPGDFSIISFDNTNYAECCDPGLTSMGADVIQLGQKAVQKIINIQGDHSDEMEEWIDMQLFERGSVKPLNNKE